MYFSLFYHLFYRITVIGWSALAVVGLTCKPLLSDKKHPVPDQINIIIIIIIIAAAAAAAAAAITITITTIQLPADLQPLSHIQDN